MLVNTTQQGSYRVPVHHGDEGGLKWGFQVHCARLEVVIECSFKRNSSYASKSSCVSRRWVLLWVGAISQELVDLGAPRVNQL